MKDMNALQSFDIFIGFHYFLADWAIHLFFFPLFLPSDYFFSILCDILESAICRHKARFFAAGCSGLLSFEGIEELVRRDWVDNQSDFVSGGLLGLRRLAVLHILIRIDEILSFFAVLLVHASPRIFRGRRPLLASKLIDATAIIAAGLNW